MFASYLKFRIFGVPLSAAVLALALVASTAAPATAAQPKQKSFSSPDEAAAALVAAAQSGDKKNLLAVLGPEATKLGSGDPVQAKHEREQFVAAYQEKHEVVKEGDGRATLVVGKNDWPLPIPLVKAGDGWQFDTAAGREEILNRRIGQNELYTIQVLLALVDAQREYAAVDRNGDGLLEYAQKFVSSKGKKDGLYWPVSEGEPPSPMGDLVANAVQEGYSRKGGKPAPYWGYYYRLLTAQGKDAPGGAYSYLAKGKMFGGFAIVAYPAKYGGSGVMSFMVSHDGVVYQKDLGPGTAQTAVKMSTFNPDASWKRVAKD
ncbi:MAG TPA: DUF2950 domain-containing protein [Burkholderiales bacterium]|nr:DUF2950 domain-containing protein [Burkholderiales bacterium]